MKSISIPVVFVVVFMSSVKFKFLDAVCDSTSCPSAVGSCVADTCWCLNQKGGASCGQSCTDDCAASSKACETINTCAACDPVCVNGACTAFGYPGTGIACKCVAGWTGDACDEVDCTSSPCDKGTCDPSTTPDRCNCNAGYTGQICDKVKDHCTPNPCQNEGNCTISGNEYSCDCAVGFTGVNCESGASRMTTALPLMLAALFIFKLIN